MRVCSLTLLVLLVCSAALAESAVSLTDVAPAGGSLAEQLRREVARARKRHLIPVVEISADWCKPCVAIKRHLGDPLMVAAFAGIHVVRLQVDDWKTEELATVSLRIRGVPVFYALDSDGKATQASITSSVWGEDVPVNMVPPLKRFFATLK